MSKRILDNLFNSNLRVKVLKFLFRNYPNEFSTGELARRIQESYSATKQEVVALSVIKLIKRKK